jgi:hypothetical protein
MQFYHVFVTQRNPIQMLLYYVNQANKQVNKNMSCTYGSNHTQGIQWQVTVYNTALTDFLHIYPCIRIWYIHVTSKTSWMVNLLVFVHEYNTNLVPGFILCLKYARFY